MEQIFIIIGRESLKKKKKFMKLLHESNLPEAWEKFDQLNCSVSYSRQNDDSMTFEEYYSLINSDALIFSSIYRKEWHPVTGKELQAMMFAVRSVSRNYWLIPANLKGMLEKKGDISRFKWFFYSGEYPEDKSLPRTRIDMENPKNVRCWEKIGRLEEKLADALPAELVPNSPKVLLNALPIGLKQMIRKEKEDTERFYWYHCPHEGDNYKKFDRIFRKVFELSVMKYINAQQRYFDY